MKRFACVLAVAAIIAVAVGVAQATTISTYDSDVTWFAVSDSDQPGTSAAVTSSVLWAGNAANLNNGGGGGGSEADISVSAGLQPGDFVTYTFDLANAAYGWDISQITTYASWTASLGGRSRQGYSVTATLMDSSVVTVLPAQVYIDGTYWSGDPPVFLGKVGTKVDIADLSLTGVKSLTFSDFVFAPGGVYSKGNIYHEIDVFGTATVPEPSAMFMGTAGLIGLLCYAWRKRR